MDRGWRQRLQGLGIHPQDLAINGRHPELDGSRVYVSSGGETRHPRRYGQRSEVVRFRGTGARARRSRKRRLNRCCLLHAGPGSLWFHHRTLSLNGELDTGRKIDRPRFPRNQRTRSESGWFEIVNAPGNLELLRRFRWRLVLLNSGRRNRLRRSQRYRLDRTAMLSRRGLRGRRLGEQALKNPGRELGRLRFRCRQLYFGGRHTKSDVILAVTKASKCQPSDLKVTLSVCIATEIAIRSLSEKRNTLPAVKTTHPVDLFLFDDIRQVLCGPYCL